MVSNEIENEGKSASGDLGREASRFVSNLAMQRGWIKHRMGVKLLKEQQ